MPQSGMSRVQGSVMVMHSFDKEWECDKNWERRSDGRLYYTGEIPQQSYIAAVEESIDKVKKDEKRIIDALKALEGVKRLLLEVVKK